MELTRQNETRAANASYSEPPKYREELPLNCSREGHHIRREIKKAIVDCTDIRSLSYLNILLYLIVMYLNIYISKLEPTFRVVCYQKTSCL